MTAFTRLSIFCHRWNPRLKENLISFDPPMKPIKRRNHPQVNSSSSIGIFEIISSDTSLGLDEWTPSKDELEGDINDAIEAIRSTVLNLQLKIKASDKYILGLLDVVADDYRAQRPSGTN